MLPGRVRSECLAYLLVILFASPSFGQGDKRLSRDLLSQDVRQLTQILEGAHPDPYVNGGGKIAFHRRLQDIRRRIPSDGLEKEAFYRLLQPFVAAVGDGHTRVNAPYFTIPYMPHGVPLYFDIVEESLFVSAVADKKHRNLIGARLVAVEGVPFAQLIECQESMMGAENYYHALATLGGTGTLWFGRTLGYCLEGWKDKTRVTVALQGAQGATKDYILDVPNVVRFPLIKPESKIRLPSRKKCDVVYDFVDKERKTALLIIDDMSSYREAFEVWRSYGVTQQMARANAVYQRFHGDTPPADQGALVAGLPSVTDIFRSLAQEMKEAHTQSLIIDLRENSGGSSVMSSILLYYLYGTEKLWAVRGKGAEIKKYSDFYFDYYQDESLDHINVGRETAVGRNDYDFNGDPKYRGEHTREQTKAEFEKFLARMPTFESEYRSGTFSGYYLPKHVVVVCSPATFSSGFWLMYYLYDAGALLVGTPSAQAGNCFGDIMKFTLNHSRLTGTISHKRFELFPDDPEKGRVLKPHYVMPYDKLIEYGCDPNAELLFALEVSDKLEG